MGLSVLFADARRDDAPRLTLPIGEIAIVIDDDVTGLTSGLGSNNSFGGHDLSSEGGLVFIDVDLDGRLVVVWGGFKKVLFDFEGGSAMTPLESYDGHD